MSTVQSVGIEDYGNLWQYGTGTGNLEWGNQTSGNTIYIQQPNTIPAADIWQTYPLIPDTTITYPSINNIQYQFYPEPKTITEQLNDIKELEALKEEHGLENFHIAIEHNNTILSPKYVFLTDNEMSFLKKYSIPINEIKDTISFTLMLAAIENKTASLKLAGTCELYETLEDLRKDHLVLKLACIKE